MIMSAGFTAMFIGSASATALGSSLQERFAVY
jgi:hypothetical protein